ncbi:MAG: polysaccharide export protein [Flavobacteriaceae bacterium]|nr:polysaccharide biosynthesis/export family protein [Bacteroidia bacterium]NNF75319.1 polysaccharide export protein [Flavobacteriaceae bacterium]NNK73119.1 polysaccharide export protein [Flavobacteriaceae bacterium]
MNFMHPLFNRLIALLVLVGLTSCVSRQEIVYFQDEPLSDQYESMTTDFEITFKQDDLLTIDVSALDPDAARPFNLPAVSYNSSSVISAQGALRMQTYLIDSKGNIEFPVLGTLKIGGLSRSEANALLKDKLTEYIKDPIVNIRLANFTITILGEVNNPGTFTIQDERISIPEALGLAGDLTIWGKRDNILLIREMEGKKRYGKIDLTSVNMMSSPEYYLTQNDVLYVEPNNARMRQSNFTNQNALIVSIVATLATITAILIR